MGLKEALLNKGWAGRTLSRAETAERLNPLIKQHMALNHYHNYAINNLSKDEQEIADDLATFQKVARVDVGKLMETVFSCGGVAYNGVDMEPEDFKLGNEDNKMLFQLLDLEHEFLNTLAEEVTLNHQIRTKAILNILLTNSQDRLHYLKVQTKRRRRPARTS